MKRVSILIFALFIASCTPTVKKVAFNRDRGDIVIVKKGSFRLTEEETRFIKLEAERLGIPIPEKREIHRELELFLKDRRGLEIALKRAGLYMTYITPILKSYGLPEELAILPLIESKFNPFAVSRSGAGGIWQLMPATAKRFGLRVGRHVDERFDLMKSTHAAAKYLKELYKRFGNWELVLAAYNCGEGCVVKKTGGKDFWSRKYRLPRQTRRFVPRFFAALLIARNPEKFGLRVKGSPLKIKRTLVSSTHSVTEFVKEVEIKESTFRDLNPHLKGNLIPANTYVYIPEKEKVAVEPRVNIKRKRADISRKIELQVPEKKKDLKVKRRTVVIRKRSIKVKKSVPEDPYKDVGRVIRRGREETVIILDNGAVVYIKE